MAVWIAFEEPREPLADGLAPLIVAHFMLDFVSFVGPTVLPDEWLDALGLV